MTTEVTGRLARSFSDETVQEQQLPRKEVSLKLATAAEVLASFELYLTDREAMSFYREAMDETFTADIQMARFTIMFAMQYPPREDVFREMSSAKKMGFCAQSLKNASRFSDSIKGISETDPGDGDASCLVDSWVASIYDPEKGYVTNIMIPDPRAAHAN